MDNYMDSRELMEMKEQLSILNQKLEKEKIVNDRMMRRVTKEKISKMQRHALIKAIAIACAIPYTCWATHWLGISPWFCAFTSALLAIALYADFRIHRNLRANEAMQGNLMDVRKKVLHIKQADRDWIKFSIPIRIVWLTWFVYEIYQQPDIPQEAIFAGIGSGGIFGGNIGFLEYRKIQRNSDEILQQIEEMEV